MPSSAPPLRIDLAPSPALGGFLAFVYGAALVCLISLPIPWWSQGLLALALALSWWREQRLHAWRNAAKAMVVLEAGEDKDWEGSTPDDSRIQLGRPDWCFIQPRLILMGKVRGLFIAPKVVVPWDALSAEDFRRLSLHLRLTNQGN